MSERWQRSLLNRIITYLLQQVEEVVKQEWWESADTVANSLGFSAQYALKAGEVEIANHCLEGLEKLSNKVVQASQASKFPAEHWEKEHVGWRLVSSLSYLGQLASEQGHSDMVGKIIELLEKMSEEASKAQAWHIASQVTITLGFIAGNLLKSMASSPYIESD